MIGAEVQAAKAASRITWQGAKVVTFAVVLFVLVGWLWWTYIDSKRRDAELKALQTFRVSVEDRQRLYDASELARTTALAGRSAQNDDQSKVIVIHDQATREAANEDPATADFLRTRIPERLRDADARARRSRRLDKD